MNSMASINSHTLNNKFTSIEHKFKRPKSTIWQILRQEDDNEEMFYYMNLFSDNNGNIDKGSGIPGYNLMFIKIAINNMDKE